MGQFVSVPLIGDVANHAKAADDCTFVVVEWIVVPFKKAFVAGLGHGEGAVPGNAAVTGEGLMKIFVFARFNEKGKEFKSGLANDVFALHAGHAFHFAIPNRVVILAIKREDAVKTDIQQ